MFICKKLAVQLTFHASDAIRAQANQTVGDTELLGIPVFAHKSAISSI